MTKTTKNSLVPLDKTVAVEYLRFLLDTDAADSFASRQAYCEKKKVHPKLLFANPHLGAIEKLMGDHSSFERLQDMTLRDYMKYHYYYLHLGFRYGAPDLQQTWLGHRLIKSPMDCWIYQELVYATKPDVVIELGVMFGGSSIFFANLFDMMGHGEVIGIDIDLSKVEHKGHKRVTYLKGSSVSDEMIAEIKKRVKGKKVMVIADSDHEKMHVLEELRKYAQFIPVGGYLICEDSLNDVMGYHPVPNEGPQAAAKVFLAENKSFQADMRVAEKFVLTISPYGFLKRVK
jgi:cephalosporin hydroxylase